MDHPTVTMVRPTASTACVTEKISRLYGLEVTKIKQLEGYDDLNFYVECKSLEDGAENKKYVCKIMNNVDSLETDVIEAQHRMMKRLNDVEHVFRLLTYVEGSKLNHCEPSSELYYSVGELVGQLYQELKGFELEALHSRKTLWLLKNAPQIIQYLPAVGDVKRQEIVKSLVKDFEDRVIPIIPNLESGVIHGDVNDGNVLVDKTRVAGLIDFGDVCYGPFLFEIATCVTYMILHARDMSAGGAVLRGYRKFRKLTDTEVRLLRTCVCARLCQSLVLSCQSALQFPGNEYVVSNQKHGWPLLEQLHQTTNQQLLSLWGIDES